MGKKDREGETAEQKAERKAAKAAKKAAKLAAVEPDPTPSPAPAVEKKPKKDKKAKAAKQDDVSGLIAEFTQQVDAAETDIRSLKPGGSDRNVQSSLNKVLTALDGVDVPADSPARNEKRALVIRVQKLQIRAQTAIKQRTADDNDDDGDDEPAPTTKRKQAPQKRVRKPPPADESHEERIARIVEERVLDALEGRDAQIRLLKDQIRYIKKNGNRMMERKAQLKNMGGSGDRFTNMTADGAMPTSF